MTIPRCLGASALADGIFWSGSEFGFNGSSGSNVAIATFTNFGVRFLVPRKGRHAGNAEAAMSFQIV